ncbi:hypothetical protein QF034_008148 [Streptomyces africanus]|uniref:Peptidase inhibitor family I36 n=1 Tax=Streptomyces africanus TaxID=231024 RepID=A0ABU0R2R2_9ACTN|nr:hypothetical protein [Streptomyces africanus]
MSHAPSTTTTTRTTRRRELSDTTPNWGCRDSAPHLYMMRAGAVAALALLPMAAPAAASKEAGVAQAGIDCPAGYVCIYPEINFGGQP